MEKIKFILQIWTKLSTHVRMRDRSVKLLQYGSQMLLGFYSAKLSKEMLDCLKLTRTTASNSRKAFWLLKSINHVGSLIDMIEKYNWDNDEGYANILDILEQIALIVYYFYENLVFLIRVKLVSFTENDIDNWGNMSWFLEDFICFMASIIRIVIQARKITIIRNELSNDSVKMIKNDHNSIIVERKLLLQELIKLKSHFADSLLTVTIVSHLLINFILQAM